MVNILLLDLFFVCFVMSVQATGIFEFFSTDITLIISRELNTEITHIISNSNLLFFKEALQTNVIRFFNDDILGEAKMDIDRICSSVSRVEVDGGL